MLALKVFSIAFALAISSACLSEPWKEGVDEMISSTDYVTGSIWPKPTVYNASEKVYSLASNEFSLDSVGETSDVLTEALKRYLYLVFPEPNEKLKPGLPQITKLSVMVLKPYASQSLESDESYKLVIDGPTSTLTAQTVWGALRGTSCLKLNIKLSENNGQMTHLCSMTTLGSMTSQSVFLYLDLSLNRPPPFKVTKLSCTKSGRLRGLETFSQVVYQDQTGFYLASGSTISDYPRFHHRGFMIDTSRHYLEPSVILKFIEAMSYSKFNVLHWHVVDDQSFPFVSEKFPELSGQGAYNNKTHIYTKDNVSMIIEYGRMHGIRVVPEFDTPGHTNSWGSIKNLLTPCYSQGKPSGSYGPINPTLDSTFTFLKTFFSEVAERFPDHYLHLGGDEVRDTCWASNPNITAWMQKMGYGQNYSLLEQHYEQNLLQIVGGLGKSYIVWQEVVDRDIKVLPDTVVNIWKGGWSKEMAKVTSMGLKAILSSCWYLNHIHYGIDWSSYYTCDPTDFDGTDEQKKLVIGGTGCMWGEYVDGGNILPRTWPRALAIGERLWSSKDVTNFGDAEKRLWEHRCRYVRRGIPAEPGLRSKYCRYETRFN